MHYYNALKNYLSETTENIRQEAHRLRWVKKRAWPFLLVIGFLLLIIFNLSQINVDNENKIKALEQLNRENLHSVKELQQELDQFKKTQQEKNQENKKKLEDLQSRKQEKQRLAALAAVVPAPIRTLSIVDLACSITASWFGASQCSAMDALINRESGYVSQWNKGGSGACGIPQALPCNKLPNGINTPLDQQIQWMCQYIKDNYGTPGSALAFHYSHNWY